MSVYIYIYIFTVYNMGVVMVSEKYVPRSHYDERGTGDNFHYRVVLPTQRVLHAALDITGY